MTLHLVRHGRPLVRRGVPAAQWELDPASYDDVWALRSSGRLPASEAAVPGWEALAVCRDRVVPTVRRVLDVHGHDDVVLVGHGTAWTVLVADLTGRPPDLERWESLAMPDVLTVEP